ncbi:hypothetical protein Droror1_Dr00016703 [Drosera rotundifolia]
MVVVMVVGRGGDGGGGDQPRRDGGGGSGGSSGGGRRRGGGRRGRIGGVLGFGLLLQKNSGDRNKENVKDRRTDSKNTDNANNTQHSLGIPSALLSCPVQYGSPCYEHFALRLWRSMKVM